MIDADFLSFRDWVDAKEHLRSDWVVVGRVEGHDKPESKATFSALTANNEESLAKILSHYDWDVSMDLGHPRFRSTGDGMAALDLGTVDSNLGVPLEAFTLYRDFHGAYESAFELAQNFLLYHNLHYDKDEEKFVNSQNDDEVVRYSDPHTVLVSSGYLKEYLAARKMVLVRFHDHRRFVKKPVETILGKKSEEISVKTDDTHYHIYVGALNSLYETFSRLLGKDLILPFSEPTHEDYLFLTGKLRRNYASFIVGTEKTGEKVESTCNEEVLSNNFVDRGTSHFLTPVFFKRDVLQRYYAGTRRYTVGTGWVSCLDLWQIPFGENKEGLVHVWLGDLGRIPYEEQLHWKLYNVPPSGGLEEAFYKTQILAEFTESEDPVYLLNRERELLNNQFEQKFGFKLFKELTGEDAYVAKSIHIPTSNEQKELDEQLLLLAKYLVDSINKADLEARVLWKPPNQNENTHTRFLEVFLVEAMRMEQTLARQVVESLRTLQTLRSLSAAHTKSTEYRTQLEKLGVAGLKPKHVIRKLVNLVTSSLSLINTSLDTSRKSDKR